MNPESAPSIALPIVGLTAGRAAFSERSRLCWMRSTMT